jgi:hypothetical protein
MILIGFDIGYKNFSYYMAEVSAEKWTHLAWHNIQLTRSKKYRFRDAKKTLDEWFAINDTLLAMVEVPIIEQQMFLRYINLQNYMADRFGESTVILSPKIVHQELSTSSGHYRSNKKAAVGMTKHLFPPKIKNPGYSMHNHSDSFRMVYYYVTKVLKLNWNIEQIVPIADDLFF